MVVFVLAVEKVITPLATLAVGIAHFATTRLLLKPTF